MFSWFLRKKRYKIIIEKNKENFPIKNENHWKKHKNADEFAYNTKKSNIGAVHWRRKQQNIHLSKRLTAAN